MRIQVQLPLPTDLSERCCQVIKPIGENHEIKSSTASPFTDQSQLVIAGLPSACVLAVHRAMDALKVRGFSDLDSTCLVETDIAEDGCLVTKAAHFEDAEHEIVLALNAAAEKVTLPIFAT